MLFSKKNVETWLLAQCLFNLFKDTLKASVQLLKIRNKGI